MTTWLPPIPGLVRRDPEHRYWLDDHLFPVSVTGVLAHGKGKVAMGRIEATRPVWEPRGNACHRAMELFLTARRPAALRPAELGMESASPPEADPLAELGDLADGDHADWIHPLLNHPRWEQVEVIASERATCCIVRNVAGTYDTAFLDERLPIPAGRPEGVSGPARVLADLKSLGPNGSTYCTRAQLGATWRWSGATATGSMSARRSGAGRATPASRRCMAGRSASLPGQRLTPPTRRRTGPSEPQAAPSPQPKRPCLLSR